MSTCDSRVTKAALVGNSSSVDLREVPVPRPGPGEILVEMQACGICGSDLEKVFGDYGQPSMRLGHEPAGVVVDVGEAGGTERAAPDGRRGVEAQKATFSRGDRVFTHHHVPCYSCHLCRHGRETMCPQYYESNLSPCGLSELYIVPAWNVEHGGVLKIDDATTFTEAAMIEPLACCVRSWMKLEHQKGDSVAVFGVGPTGMMHVMLAASRGSSSIICVDVNEFRLDFARRVGATDAVVPSAGGTNMMRERTGGLGVDISIVATSSIAALRDAISATRKGGTVMMFGVPSKNAMLNLNMGDVYSREISLLTSYAASDRDTADALDIIESNKIDVKSLVTHTYPLSESQKAFEHARSGDGAIKIAITKD